MLNKWKRQGIRGKVEMPRGKDLLMVASRGRFEIQDKPRFKKKVSNRVPSEFPNARDDRVFNLSLKMEGILFHQP